MFAQIVHSFFTDGKKHGILLIVVKPVSDLFRRVAEQF